MKTVMILGGTKGVGNEVLKSCVKAGYNVSFCGRSHDLGHSIIDSHKDDKERLYFHKVDLNTISQLKEYCNQTLLKFKTIDALVVYSGITPVSSILETEENTFDEVFNINLKAPFFLLKLVLKEMIKQKCGSIIFFGSAHMDYGQMDRTAYALTKGALYNLSNHIAHHYAQFGIRSNYVVMGWTDTEGELELRSKEGISKSELHSQAARAIPMGRMLNRFDPVPAVMHFISDDSKMTTGSLIRITGGEYI